MRNVWEGEHESIMLTILTQNITFPIVNYIARSRWRRTGHLPSCATVCILHGQPWRTRGSRAVRSTGRKSRGLAAALPWCWGKGKPRCMGWQQGKSRELAGQAGAALARTSGRTQRFALLRTDIISFLTFTSTESGFRISQCAWFWTY